jgi:hypothetical protein
MSTAIRHYAVSLVACVAGILLLGCQGTVSLIPNADVALRKPPAVFAADAAKRQYEADAPKASDKEFRAQYALMIRQVDLANISDRDYSNVEVWINGKYVVCCPNFQKKSDKTLNFTMFYDRQGHHFETNYGNNPIQSIEVYRDGKMFSVVDHIAD